MLQYFRPSAKLLLYRQARSQGDLRGQCSQFYCAQKN